MTSESSLVDEFVHLKGHLAIVKYLQTMESRAFSSLCLVLVNVVVSHSKSRDALVSLMPCLNRWILDHGFDVSVFALLALLMRSGKGTLTESEIKVLIKVFMDGSKTIAEETQDIWELTRDALVDGVSMMGLDAKSPVKSSDTLVSLLEALTI